MSSTSGAQAHGAGGRVRIWDLPTRLFHWSLAALVTFSIVTAKLGGLWLDWHMRSGYAILALLVFRLLWAWPAAGMRGSFTSCAARASCWLTCRGGIRTTAPATTAGRAVGGGDPRRAARAGRHGPVSPTTAASPRGRWRSWSAAPPASGLSTLHRWGELAIYALIALHLAAVLFYLLVRRDNLIGPMISGDRRGIDAHPARDDPALWLRAAVMLALAAGLTTYVVRL